MTVKVYKDQDANAVFIGNANGVQFLNSLQATMDNPSDVVINVQDLSKGIEIFSDVPFGDFVDQSGSVYGSTALEVCKALNAEFSAAAKPAPTAPTDYATTDVYFYFGWQSKNGGWLVRRQTRSTGLLERADVSNNSSITTYTNAWLARSSLTYGSA